MDDNHPIPLVLPKTGLRFEDGRLIKVTPEGERLTELPLSALKDIRVESTLNPIGIALSFVMLGLAIVCKVFIGIELVSWTLGIILMGAFLFALCMVRSKQIIVESDAGKATYDFSEADGDAEGFVLSVRALMEPLTPKDA